ncbi:MAG: preprotein translocase subunit SecY [Zavarzinella sp.]
MSTFLSLFAIPELRRKIFITALFLIVYRIGFFVPLPVVNQLELGRRMAAAESGSFGQVLGLVSAFSGGSLTNACIFALGIMPYISASIILQLLAASELSPYLARLRKEPNGQKKINEYTRYLTVPITLVQATFWYRGLIASGGGGGSEALLAPGYSGGFTGFYFAFAAVLTVTVGTIFLMWVGEQIDEYGIGNGISLIIMAGIVSRIPDALRTLFLDPVTGGFKKEVFTLGAGTGDISFEKLLLMIVLFIVIIVGVILMTKAQRRIPMQSAKHVRGRRVTGGTRSFLPMKINQAGVMPVIFASSLLLVPMFLFQILAQYTGNTSISALSAAFQRNAGWIYNMSYVLLIYFFCYFWTSITFNPKEMANNLKENGSFIPGYRPGKSTAEYLEKVLLRITYVGAAFLAVIAIIPSIANSELGIDYSIATYFGGTSLLIVVSVCLDFVSKINSHLVMRGYPGLSED